MLDVIRVLISENLGLSTAEVNQIREDLLKAQATADASYATTSALLHPEGSTTPIVEAYSRSQARVANLRKKTLQHMPRALSSLLALEVAIQRRDEAELHRSLKWNQEYAKDKLGVDPAVKNYWDMLHKHGVQPNYLKNQALPITAIIADLISWKAKDPTFKDADNPWRAVLGIYAGRRIEMPKMRKQRAERSFSGTPTRDRHISDMGDYMFNELVDPDWALTTPAAVSVNNETVSETSTPADPVCNNDDEGLSPTVEAEAASTALPPPAETKNEASPPQAKPPHVPAIVESIVDEDRAQTIAEAIYAADPVRLRIYWPTGWVSQDDFGSPKLIEALETWIASGAAWPGAERFLAAIKKGEGREFIAEQRRRGINALIRQIVEGDGKVLDRARSAGFDV